jgi:hypothetical protein
MESANSFALLAERDPKPSKTKSKNREKKPPKSKGIISEEQMTASLDMKFLPPEAETSEVIQKQGICHAFGSVLVAPLSPPFSTTFSHENSLHLFKLAKQATFRKVVVTLDV